MPSRSTIIIVPILPMAERFNTKATIKIRATSTLVMISKNSSDFFMKLLFSNVIFVFYTTNYAVSIFFGKIKFKRIATRNTTATQFCANTF